MDKKRRSKRNSPHHKRKPLITALEPRVLLDGAAVATGAEAATDVALQQDSTHTNDEQVHDASEVELAPVGDNKDNRRKEVAFVDTQIANYQTIVDNIDDHVEVYLIEGSENGLDSMLESLEGQQGIEAIHVFSHGDVGELQLGSLDLNSSNLADNALSLQQIGSAMSQTGDILLYGCQVAGDASGLSFIDQLAEMTRADITASDDLTGAANLMGDWDLEAETADIEAEAFEVLAFDGVLNSAPVVDGTPDADRHISPASSTNVEMLYDWNSSRDLTGQHDIVAKGYSTEVRYGGLDLGVAGAGTYLTGTDFGGGFTIATTFSFEEVNGGSHIVDFGSNHSSNSIVIKSTEYGSITAEVWRDGHNASITVDNFYTISRWTGIGETFHLALSVTDSGHMSLYKNGVLVGEANGHAPHTMHRDRSAIGVNTKGFMSDLIILDDSLDAGGISELHQRTNNNSLNQYIETFKESGSFTFSDADPGDGHVLYLHMPNNHIGSFNPGWNGYDAVWWDYTVNASDFEFLAEGEQRVMTYNLELRDNSGASAWQPVTITLTGTNDPLVLDQSVDLVGAVEKDAVVLYDMDSGNDLSDSNHQLTLGDGAVLNNGALEFNSAGASLDDLDIGGAVTIASTFTYEASGGWARIVDLGNGQQSDNILIGSPEDGKIAVHILHGDTVAAALEVSDFFTVGETFHMAFTVDDNGHMSLYKNGVLMGENANGSAASSVTRTSNLLGKSNWGGDALTDGSMSDLVILNDHSGVSKIAQLYELASNNNLGGYLDSDVLLKDSGSFTYTDADISENHTLSYSADANNYVGTFTPTLDSANRTVNWNFEVDNSAIVYLEDGEQRVQNYTIALSESNGHTVSQRVSVTITGSDDGPLIDVTDVTGFIGQDSSLLFDMSSTTDVADNNHQLTLGNGAVLKNGVLEFNSAGAQLDSLDIGGAMTIASTFMFDGYDTWARIVDLGNGQGNDNILIGTNGEGNITVQIFDGNSYGNASLSVDNFYTVGEAFHMAFAVDENGTYVFVQKWRISRRKRRWSCTIKRHPHKQSLREK